MNVEIGVLHLTQEKYQCQYRSYVTIESTTGYLIITSGIIIPSLNFPIHLSKRQSKWDKSYFLSYEYKEQK